MIEWLKTNVNPIGTEKKNRGSLFSLIGRVFGIVRKDAEKAFNAHFPFLADERKLAEHGKALSIPRMESDTYEEFRNRVAAASFFLSRAGERSYILGQLDEHFAGRYACKEEFLQVFVKVLDLSDDDRKWVLTFLDTILDPNIFLSVAEWFHFIEKIRVKDSVFLKIGVAIQDSFKACDVKLNGRVKLDGRSLNDTIVVRPKLNGRAKLNGGMALDAKEITIPVSGYVRTPVKLGRGIIDKNRLRLKTKHTEAYRAKIKLNGSIKVAGSERLAGFGRINDAVRMGARYSHKLNRVYRLNGRIKLNSGIIVKV